METIFVSGHTDAGRLRKENQDAWLARSLWSADKTLALVVDGVGGYAGGEKAAAIARDSIDQYMQAPSGDILTMLREAVVFANNRIVEERKTDPLLSEMCCVLTVLVADAVAGDSYFAHVGDTRLYRYRAGQLDKLSKDHSFVGIQEDAGNLSETEAMQHPQRNQILRGVGTSFHRLDDEDFLDYGREPLLPGDLLLLCSDGLTDMVTTRQIIDVLSSAEALTNKSRSLVNLANEHGGTDNVTVVLLQYPMPPLDKKTDAAVDEHAPVALAAEARVAAAAVKKRQPVKTVSLAVSLLLFALMGASWYFTPAAPAQVVVSQPMVVPDSSRLQAGTHEVHAAVPGPVPDLQPDTLKIASTQNFTAIRHRTDSTRKMLVIMPGTNKTGKFAAIAITEQSAEPGDTLSISNLHFVGFETGIDIQVPVFLKTQNLVFENTGYPFRYPCKPATAHNAVLFINAMK